MGFSDWFSKSKTGSYVVGQKDTSWIDSFKGVRTPGKRGLIDQYEGTPYACARYNSQAIASQKLRLYAEMKRGSKLATSPLTKSQKADLTNRWHSKTFTNRRMDSIELVEEHPVLDLIAKPNALMHGFQFFDYAQRYQEICGNCFILIQRDTTGAMSYGSELTGQLWILPAHEITPYRDKTSFMPQFYDWCGSSGRKLLAEDVIWISEINLMDPYAEGMSPLRMTYETLNLDNLAISTLVQTFANEGKPIGVLSGEDLDLEVAEKLEKRFFSKFGGPNKSKLMTLDSRVHFDPISWSPVELAAIDIHKMAKQQISDSFGLPIFMIQQDFATFASYNAALSQWYEHTINPKLRHNESVWNDKLLPLFPDTANMCLLYDLPVSSEERKVQLEEQESAQRAYYSKAQALQLAIGGKPWVSTNEARAIFDLVPIAGGDDLINEESPVESSIVSSEAAVATNQEANTNPEAVASGAQLAQIVAIITATSSGQIPRDAAIQTLVNFCNLTPENAAAVLGSAGLTPAPTPTPEAQPETTPEKSEKIGRVISNHTEELLRQALDSISTILAKLGEQPESTPEPPFDASRMPLIRSQPPGAGDETWQKKCVYEGLVSKSGRKYELPKGKELKKAIADWVDVAQDEYLSQADIKDLPKQFVPINKLTEELDARCRPVVELLWEDAGKSLLQQVGISKNVFNVTNPKLQETIAKQTLKFCESTNNRMVDSLNNTLQKVRQSLQVARVEEGARPLDLRDEIKSLFNDFKDWEADRIARTESSRAYHDAQIESAKVSGVVSGMELLLSDAPCPECQELFDTEPQISINDPAWTLPVHPFCTCSYQYILTENE